MGGDIGKFVFYFAIYLNCQYEAIPERYRKTFQINIDTNQTAFEIVSRIKL